MDEGVSPTETEQGVVRSAPPQRAASRGSAAWKFLKELSGGYRGGNKQPVQYPISATISCTMELFALPCARRRAFTSVPREWRLRQQQHDAGG
jgi:hypothetical protein